MRYIFIFLLEVAAHVEILFETQDPDVEVVQDIQYRIVVHPFLLFLNFSLQ